MNQFYFKLICFAQGLLKPEEVFVEIQLNIDKNFDKLLFVLLQSKPLLSDVEYIVYSKLVNPNTSSVSILKKGLHEANISRIKKLVGRERERGLYLLLYIFRRSYLRRFELEMNNPDKWWYWNFSDEHNVQYFFEKHCTLK